ncbi:DNA invertase Pin-like site-specific DNA recombinase [Paenibacillus baekrokdamisoli]|nr:DNA invertase Pin-like site-specific DNA recombinase [Paenibacillus baekrokdamisoli]
MILEKRQRSPLRPDFPLIRGQNKKSGLNSDRKNIPSVQRLIVRLLSSTYIVRGTRISRHTLS